MSGQCGIKQETTSVIVDNDRAPAVYYDTILKLFTEELVMVFQVMFEKTQNQRTIEILLSLECGEGVNSLHK